MSRFLFLSYIISTTCYTLEFKFILCTNTCNMNISSNKFKFSQDSFSPLHLYLFVQHVKGVCSLTSWLLAIYFIFNLPLWVHPEPNRDLMIKSQEFFQLNYRPIFIFGGSTQNRTEIYRLWDGFPTIGRWTLVKFYYSFSLHNINFSILPFL